MLIHIFILIGSASFVMAFQGRSQLKELRKQNQMSISKNEPILKCTDFKFNGNKPRFLITNVGGGRAMWIGVSTQFHPSISNQPKIRQIRWSSRSLSEKKYVC